jgi:hypothetical protein
VTTPVTCRCSRPAGKLAESYEVRFSKYFDGYGQAAKGEAEAAQVRRIVDQAYEAGGWVSLVSRSAKTCDAVNR